MNDHLVPRAALAWIIGDDTGQSSKEIWRHMLGFGGEHAWHPMDPSDLGRCFRLLDLVPAWKARIGEMARYGFEWAYLVGKWDELRDMMEREVGIDWSRGRSAPNTYFLMNRHREQAHG